MRIEPLLALERHREILNLLAEKGSARVSELAQRFDVTEETIRRDLDKLEAEGRLSRSHGGAVSRTDRENETPHWQREYLNTREKEAIAREAVKLVQEQDRLILDASSTSWFVARRLPDVPLTVITNSLHVALVLAERPHCKVISPGGTLTAASMSLVGSESQQALLRYHARLLFVSCRGFDVPRGAFDISEEQAMVRRTMLEISDEHVLLVDSSKLGSCSLSMIAPPASFHRLITADKADPELCRLITESGLTLTRAELM